MNQEEKEVKKQRKIINALGLLFVSLELIIFSICSINSIKENKQTERDIPPNFKNGSRNIDRELNLNHVPKQHCCDNILIKK